MAAVTTLRDGLQTRLATITGLNAHDIIPAGNLVPPAALIALDSIEYDEAMGRGLDRYTFTVRVYLAAQNDRAAQDKLDGYLASSGATSVKAAIEGDKTLAGSATSARVVSVSSYGIFEHGEVPYLGAEWTVDVYATGA